VGSIIHRKPVLGWRYWVIDRERLELVSPMVKTGAWPHGERFVATYEPGNSRCGVNAYASHQALIDSGHPFACEGPDVAWQVVGTVSMWGKVARHELGYRSQYAYPHTLYAASAAQAQTVREIAAAYGARYGGVISTRVRRRSVALASFSLVAALTMLVAGILTLDPDHGGGWLLLTMAWLVVRVLWQSVSEGPASLYLEWQSDAKKPLPESV
jgi:hypothetical protein